ncbi:MAG: HD domain-containing protein [Sorangiineae bacterium PRO1]|nr:HD domain-containing protein [Sorangiineae bacterium PRO1]
MTGRTTLTNRFDEALTYAREHHRDDWRKGTDIPYISHLLGVCSLVLDMEGSENEAIAALLHDVIEDGGGPEAEAVIRERFGDDVARIVRACSDTDEDPKPPWRARKEAYIDAIAHKAPDELRVSLADKIHNARAILLDVRAEGDELWKRFSAGRDEQLWYYGALAAAFAARRADLGEPAGPAVDELQRVVAEIRQVAGGVA